MMDKKSILVVEDDVDFLESLSNLLETEGYEVLRAKSAKECYQILKNTIPHLIILDLILPQIDGLNVCKELKKNIKTKYIPMIVLTVKNDLATEIECLNLGVDDFIIKPPIPKELLTKVAAVIKRTYLGLDANPLTKLPGNNSLREELIKRINADTPFAVCYIDLDNFKAFNDKFGYAKGDSVIKLTAECITDAVLELGSAKDFIAHIGGDDFVVITTPSHVDNICKKIIEEFDRKILGFYPEEDIERGYIISRSREGFLKKFPIMTISISVVTNSARKFKHIGEIESVGISLKEYIKSFPKSNYIVDRRENKAKVGDRLYELKDALWQELTAPLVEDNTSKSIVVDDVTGLPSLRASINRIKSMIEERSQVGLMYIYINSYSKKLKESSWRDGEYILKVTADILKELQGSVFRRGDILLTYESKRENALIFILPPSNKDKLCISDLENIAYRLELALTDKIKKILGEYTAQLFSFHIGYAIMEDVPEIPKEKLIYSAIDEGFRIAYEKEEFKRWRMSSKLKEIINEEKVYILFQPIFDVVLDNIIGYEALARGAEIDMSHPEVLFDLAQEAGLIRTLEYLCHKKAINSVEKLKNKLLFINIEPEVIVDPKFMSAEFIKSAGLDISNIVLEMPESIIMKEYRLLKYALQYIKEKGYKLCFDKFKGGYENLDFILNLQPNFIKLDISLTRDIGKNSISQHFIRLLLDLLKVPVIAMGIETKEQSQAAKELGIIYQQGFYFKEKDQTFLKNIKSD